MSNGLAPVDVFAEPPPPPRPPRTWQQLRDDLRELTIARGGEVRKVDGTVVIAADPTTPLDRIEQAARCILRDHGFKKWPLSKKQRIELSSAPPRAQDAAHLILFLHALRQRITDNDIGGTLLDALAAGRLQERLRLRYMGVEDAVAKGKAFNRQGKPRSKVRRAAVSLVEQFQKANPGKRPTAGWLVRRLKEQQITADRSTATRALLKILGPANGAESKPHHVQ